MIGKMIGKIMQKNTFYRLWLVLQAVVLCPTSSQTLPETCRRPTVQLGLCVAYNDCPDLEPFTHTLPIRTFLRNYGCGRKNGKGDVRVCCPIEFPGSHSTISDAVGAVGIAGSDSTVSDPVSAVGIAGSDSTVPDKNCGRRIVGLGPQWPFVASIGRLRSTQDGFLHYCNGVFITDKIVLTSGVCIMARFVTHVIPLSAWSKGQTTEFFKIQQRFLRDITDDGRRSEGLGLLQLQEVVTFNDFVQSVCLPDPQERDTPSLLHVIGGTGQPGNTQIIHRTVTRVSATTCDASNSMPLWYFTLHLVDICTTGLKICAQGGWNPLVVDEDNSQLRIQGIGGYSKNLCTEDVTVYTAVKPHIKWIEAKIKDTPILSIPNSGEIHRCGRQAVGDGPEHPYMAALGRFQNGFFTATCSGVLIEPSWILTEAACIVDDSHITHAQIMNGRPKSVAIIATRFHESYNPFTKESNIGMVKLQNPLNFDEVVCLPSAVEISRNMMAAIGIYGNPSLVSPGSWNYGTAIASVYYADQCEVTKNLSHSVNSDSLCIRGFYGCLGQFCSQWMLLSRDPDTSIFSVDGVGSSNYPVGDPTHVYTQVSLYLQWIQQGI